MKLIRKSINALKRDFRTNVSVKELTNNLIEKTDEDSLQAVHEEIFYLRIDIEYCNADIEILYESLNNKNEDPIEYIRGFQSVIASINYLETIKKELEKNLETLEIAESRFTEFLAEKKLKLFFESQKGTEKKEKKSQNKTKFIDIIKFIISIPRRFIILAFFPAIFYGIEFLVTGKMAGFLEWPYDTMVILIIIEFVVLMYVSFNFIYDLKELYKSN